MGRMRAHQVMATIEVIPHEDHRYPTVGDWITPEESTAVAVPTVRVSQMPNRKYERLVAIHELVEMQLCADAGVTGEAVTEFDVAWVKEYDEAVLRGDTPAYEEPGDDPRAPYYKMHKAAEYVEKAYALVMSLDWNEYERFVDGMP